MGVFDKWTKKATNTAVETATETLKQKTNDIFTVLKIGLTATIIIFGGKHLVKPSASNQVQTAQPMPPIVINNYYDRGYIPNGRQQVQYGKKH